MVVVIGFSLGGIFLFVIDRIILYMYFGKKKVIEGIIIKMKRFILLVFFIILYNIFEGLVIGVVFGVIGVIIGFIEVVIVVVMVFVLGIGI